MSSAPLKSRSTSATECTGALPRLREVWIDAATGNPSPAPPALHGYSYVPLVSTVVGIPVSTSSSHMHA
jgi:hypothetical protein